MNVRNVMKSVQESDLHIFWNCKATTQNRLMPSQTDSSKPKPDPCQRYACRIQDCLQKNNYQESKCVKFIRDLEECCKKFAGKSPTVCQGIRFDLPDTNGERRLWLQSRYKPYFQNSFLTMTPIIDFFIHPFWAKAFWIQEVKWIWIQLKVFTRKSVSFF